jgi:hypothetical protein
VAETSRYGSGGFSPRFVVTRADGKPCRPGARYMVLDGSGADPHALKALSAYAESVRAENPELAAGLDRMLGGDWPKELAQHGTAE